MATNVVNDEGENIQNPMACALITKCWIVAATTTATDAATATTLVCARDLGAVPS